MNINSRLNEIISLLKGTYELSEYDSETIRRCFDIVHKPTPLDVGNSFVRIEDIIRNIDDLQYTILCLKNKRIEIETNVNKMRDPQFVSLVRQQRPSTQAILSEIRLVNPDVVNEEEKLVLISNIIEYLETLCDSMNKFMWNLREKVNYTKN